MKIEPCGHRVIVRADKVEEISKGGIIVSVGDRKDREQRSQTTGVVIAIGPNAWKAFDGGEPWAAVGDRVTFAKYGGWQFEHDGEDLRLLNDEDITGRVVE